MKKKINSNSKGKRGEREIVKLLNKFYNTDEFKRVPNSGGFATSLSKLNQVNKELISDVVGDIITPKWFPYTIEVKFYKDIPTIDILLKLEVSTLKTWVEQIDDESLMSKKPIILVFRKNRGSWLVLTDKDKKKINNKVQLSINNKTRYIFIFQEFLNEIKIQNRTRISKK